MSSPDTTPDESADYKYMLQLLLLQLLLLVLNP